MVMRTGRSSLSEANLPTASCRTAEGRSVLKPNCLCTCLSLAALLSLAFGALQADVTAEAFRVRDPFVLADETTQTYYLYNSTTLGEGTPGVSVRTSRDLVLWSEPTRVMDAPAGIPLVWAPEVHRYRGAYWMFVTLKEAPDPKRPVIRMGPDGWSPNLTGDCNSWHATWIYRAERPTGPFRPVSGRPITPPGWLALDGTLAVEDGRPYLVFTHDWAQVADGTIELAPLTDDLTALAAPPKTIIRASAVAPNTRRGVTDGPFVYRSSKSGRLFVMWSTHNPNKPSGSGYCVVASESLSGRLAGPWGNHRIISDENGGHGMVFRTFGGRLKFALHQPEEWGREHARFFDFVDDGGTVSVRMPKTFDVRAYSSVAATVAACRAAGGGRIVVPKGIWRSDGPVQLASDCELHLEEGAELVFSDSPKDYLPAVRVAYEGVECYNYSPLVYAYGATNVAVTGKGTLRAAHAFWYAWNWHNPESRKALDDLADVWPAEGRPVAARDMTKIPGCRLRPQFLHFNRCRNVRVEGVRIRESPFWCIHTYACNGVVVRNVDVCAHIHNSDGLDLEMTKNALVEGCTFCQGDDAICVKSGRNLDGRTVGIASENIEIRDCEIKAGHQLLALGSEVSAGIRNVWLHDCRMTGATFNGLLIKTNKERGGFVENVRFERVTAAHLEGAPVAIDANTFYSEPKPGVEPCLTRIRDIRVKDVTADEADGVYSLKGDPDCPIENVTLENVTVRRRTGGPDVAENVKGLHVE